MRERGKRSRHQIYSRCSVIVTDGVVLVMFRFIFGLYLLTLQTAFAMISTNPDCDSGFVDIFCFGGRYDIYQIEEAVRQGDLKDG